MSIALDPVDLSAAGVGTTGILDWTGLGSPGGSTSTRVGTPHLRLFNESGAGISVSFPTGSSDRLPAGGWADFELHGDTRLTYTVEYVLPGAPVALLLGTLYGPGEPLPPIPALGNSPIGVGGTVSTTTGNSLKNDNNPPGTSLIEATPSDQGGSATQDYNDGSGFRKILSAGVLRYVYNIIRGNATSGKASLQIGDSADASITTIYGTIGGGSVVPAATVQPGSVAAGQFAFTGTADGTPALASERTAAAAGDVDLLDLIRVPGGVGTPNTERFGIDTNGRMFILDVGRSNYLVQGASYETTSALGGRIPTMRTAGGGASGAVIWEGATDPAASSAEGDLWIPG